VRYKALPADFTVEEQIALPRAKRGTFAIYRVEKRGVTTLAVQTQIAQQLRLSRTDIQFPALKDKQAVATQYVTIRGTGPTRIAGNGFDATFAGRSSRPLTPRDITGNRFTLVLRDLLSEEASLLSGKLAVLAERGLPNYFDDQRFGSLAPGSTPIGKLILLRDAEGALRAYFTQHFAGDPSRVRQFKTFAQKHWQDWKTLFEAAPRPSNFRSVLTYLQDHPGGDDDQRRTVYRKALNLITPRLLAIYVQAYQSLLWNRVVGQYVTTYFEANPNTLEITGERFPVYDTPPPAPARQMSVPLPSHRATYNDPGLTQIVTVVLTREGLTLDDMKVRILKKAYLPKSSRPLLVFPKEVSTSGVEPDDVFEGSYKRSVSFTLPRGCYATLLIKALELLPGNENG